MSSPLNKKSARLNLALFKTKLTKTKTIIIYENFYSLLYDNKLSETKIQSY